MAKESYPALLFYGREFYGDSNVVVMTLEQESAYLRMIWFCWQEGSISADHRILAALCKGMPLERFQADIWPALHELFEDSGDGRLTHSKVERIRSDKRERSEQKSFAGRRSAATRGQQNLNRPSTEPQQTSTTLLPVCSPSVGTDTPTEFNNPISNLQSINKELTIVSSSAERSAEPTQGGWEQPKDGATHLDEFFEERFRAHPKKRDRSIAQGGMSKIPGIDTARVQDEFRCGHNAWLKSNEFTYKAGATGRTLAEFIHDRGWTYDPPAELPAETHPQTKASFQEASMNRAIAKAVAEGKLKAA